MPSRFIVSGISLTASEYNQYVKLANVLDVNGLMPTEKGYDENSTLLGELNSLIKTDYYLEASPEMQGKAIKAQFNNFYNNAEKKIIQQLAVTNEVFREKLKKADIHPVIWGKSTVIRTFPHECLGNILNVSGVTVDQ